ncbi:predicted protein [Chaetoceros tenuissimus]|uniref:Uncharacterized protein n=1 Tax=Chaetoceros tenuissimus TaxID=426638 RepID=A0AAD3GZN7_9STRA|nr:predicted protein [Chaetoceros tenuissimus]
MGGQITFEIQEETSSSSLTLSADGRKVVVGIIGVSFDEMQVYTFNNNEWNLRRSQEIGKVDSLSAVQEEFGKSVAITYDGNYIAAGSTEDTGPGYVWLYDFMIE